MLLLACLAIAGVAAYCFTKGWALFKGSRDIPKDPEVERERFAFRLRILPWFGPRLHAPEAGVALMIFGIFWVIAFILLVFSQ